MSILRLAGCLLVAAQAVAVPASASSAAADPAPGRRMAVVIGVSKYRYEPWNNLRFPAKDASDLSRALQSPRIGGWSPDDVALLTDEDATLSRAKSMIRRILGGGNRGDFILVYFSGHGFVVDGKAYLALQDSVPTSAASGLDMDELREWLVTEGEGASKLLILDACHSGGVIRARGVNGMREVSNRGSDVFAALKSKLADLPGGVGYITSSGTSETSKEGETNGLFTQSLLGALRGEDGEDARFVTLGHVYDHVRKNIVGQTPQLGGDLPTGLPLAIRSPAGRPTNGRETKSGAASSLDLVVEFLGRRVLQRLESLTLEYESDDARGTQRVDYPGPGGGRPHCVDQFEASKRQLRVELQDGAGSLTIDGKPAVLSDDALAELNVQLDRDLIWIFKQYLAGQVTALAARDSAGNAVSFTMRAGGVELGELVAKADTGEPVALRFRRADGTRVERRYLEFRRVEGLYYPMAIEDAVDGGGRSRTSHRRVVLRVD